MERNAITGAAALERGVALLLAILDAEGGRTIGDIAAELALPASTARRMVGVMARRGLLLRIEPARFVAGPALASRDATAQSELLAHAARPVLRALARTLLLTAHVGILAEAMVTYVAKEGARAKPIFTREDRQLEAYCSAVGKVLLAALPHEQREAYLAAEPFIALTARTITSPDRLREALADVARSGHAIDDGEAAGGLYCIGVPITGRDGSVAAALSVSGPKARFARFAQSDVLARLKLSALAITARREPRG